MDYCYFVLVDLDSMLSNNVTQEFNFWAFKLALGELDFEISVTKSLENEAEMVQMLLMR